MSDDAETKLYPSWRQVESDLIARGLRDGETIPMDYLRRGFGCEDPSGLPGVEAIRQQAVFNFALGELAASLLENHRTMLRLVPGVGYTVVPPEDQTGITMKDTAAGLTNMIARGIRGLSFVRIESLDDTKRKENADALAKMAALQVVARKRLTRA